MIIAEKILFNVIAFFLFVIVFVKLIRKNDTNYIIILILQAIRYINKLYRNFKSALCKYYCKNNNVFAWNSITNTCFSCGKEGT